MILAEPLSRIKCWIERFPFEWSIFWFRRFFLSHRMGESFVFWSFQDHQYLVWMKHSYQRWYFEYDNNQKYRQQRWHIPQWNANYDTWFMFEWGEQMYAPLIRACPLFYSIHLRHDFICVLLRNVQTQKFSYEISCFLVNVNKLCFKFPLKHPTNSSQGSESFRT